MTARFALVLLCAAMLTCVLFTGPVAQACCPAPPDNKAVLNADQTVIMLWDEKSKTQHFIRQASFKSDAADFGFIIPSPTQPQLEESGNQAFEFLAKVTAPEVIEKSRPVSYGCSGGEAQHSSFHDPLAKVAVTVLEEKQVAGFDAVVLEATSESALVDWLKENGFSFSPAVEAWAAPYVKQGWKFTALKVSKKAPAADQAVGNPQPTSPAAETVDAPALRMTFKTDKPLFPYREPKAADALKTLGKDQRMLRIFFVADKRYQGELTQDKPWTGVPAWSGKLKDEQKAKLLEHLKLPAQTGPEKFWLTEFEDLWPYEEAPADLYFSASASQKELKRTPHIVYVSAGWPGAMEPLAYVVLAAMALGLVKVATRKAD